MRIAGFWKSVVVATLVVFMAGCGGDESGHHRKSPQDDSDVVVNDDVRVLDASARDHLNAFAIDIDTNQGELRFKKSDSFAQSIEVGAILASRPVAGVAKAGFLQRVKARRTDGDEIVFETSQATLTETFNKANIHLDKPLRADDLESTETQNQNITAYTTRSSGLKTRRQSLEYTFGLDFDRVLVDKEGSSGAANYSGKLTLDGGLQFNAGVNADIDIGWFASLDKFSFSVDVGESFDVGLTGELAAGFEKRVKVAHYNFGSFTIAIGPVPVTFVIDMDIYIGVDGHLEAKIETGVAQSSTLTLGAEYTDDNGWRDLTNFESSFDVQPPTLTGRATARGFAEPRLTVKIYGLAGPFIFARGYAKGDAEFDRSPFWTISAGIDVGIGFIIDLPVVGTVGEWSKSFNLFEKKLQESVNQGPELDVLSPDDGVRTDEGVATSFSVEASDREQSTVDVSLTDDNGSMIDQATVEKDESTLLNAGGLCVGTHTFEITARDGDGATDTATRTITVLNGKPTVDLADDTLIGADALPLFPGGFLLAYADASDRTCQDYDGADQDLIQWSIDGNPVGRTGKLVYRLPNTYAPGDQITVEARYDDGQKMGSATVEPTLTTRPPGADFEPRVFMKAPEDQQVYVSRINSSIDFTFEGTGIDTEDGELTGADLLWEISKFSGGWTTLGHGTSVEVNFSDYYAGTLVYTSHEVRLTATDSDGNTSTKTVSISVTPPG